MGKKKKEAVRLQELSNRVDRWLKGYQRASLLIMAVGIIVLLHAIMEVAGFMNNSFGSFGITYSIHLWLLQTPMEASWINAIYLAITFAIMALFAAVSIFAAKGNAWAMYLGIILYTADLVYIFVLSFLEGFASYYPMIIMHGVLLLGMGTMVFYYYKANYYWKLYQIEERNAGEK